MNFFPNPTCCRASHVTNLTDALAHMCVHCRNVTLACNRPTRNCDCSGNVGGYEGGRTVRPDNDIHLNVLTFEDLDREARQQGEAERSNDPWTDRPDLRLV